MLKSRYTGCVYLATNTVNGRGYIGKSISGLSSRKISHHHAANRGKPGPFMSALRKHGFGAFQWETLFESDDEQLLLAAEVALIADCAGMRLYNVTPGGEGVSIPCSDERREKLRVIMANRPVKDETRAKLRANQLGVRQSPESIEKMRQSKIGKKLKPWTDERRAKRAATWAAKIEAGWRPSPETRARQSEAAKRRALQPEERARKSEIGKRGAKARWG